MKFTRHLFATFIALNIGCFSFGNYGLAQVTSQNQACPGYWVMAEFSESPVILTDGEGTYRGTFTASTSTESNLADISTDAAGSFSFSFAAPAGQTLAVGDYSNCTRYPFQSSLECGLNVSGHGRGCNKLGAGFKVLEIERDGTGKLSKFAANYYQDCENSGQKLYGAIRFKSTMPIELSCNSVVTPTPTPTGGSGGGSGECEAITIGNASFSLCDGKLTDSDGLEAGSEVREGESGNLVVKGVKYSARRSSASTNISAKINKASGKYVAQNVRAIIVTQSGAKGLYIGSVDGTTLSRIKAKLNNKGKVVLSGVPNAGTIQ